jgi:RHS repeat-associated protein
VWTYTWSSDNKLLSSVRTFYGTPDKSTSFDYDALGRPVIKRSGSTPGSGHVIRATLYDGGTVLADLDSAGNREAEYVYDEGTDRPYAMLTGSTTVTAERFYAQDDMGNVDGLFKDHATVTETVTYGDWGLPVIWGDTTNRFTWKGLSYDPDVGLTYMRSRWYDPNIGRFVSEDPLGLGGGINPYVFANNDPINGGDPTGLSEWIDRFGDGGDGFDPGCTYTVRFQYSGDPILADAVGPVAVLDSACSYKHDDSPPQAKTPAPTTSGGTSPASTSHVVAKIKALACRAVKGWEPPAGGYGGVTASYFLFYGLTAGIGLYSDDEGPGIYLRGGWGIGLEGTGGSEKGAVFGSLPGVAVEGEIVGETRAGSVSIGSTGATVGGGKRAPSELPVMGHVAVTYTKTWSLASLCH